jgi:hypothetical protein
VRLPERIVAIHRSLSKAGVPHAFGGAIALAYATLEPRGTRDIDVNIFVPAETPGPALAALPGGIDQPPGTEETIARDGQVRLWWDETPVDLFFDYVPLHDEAARNRRTVPFENEQLPILGPIELAVFKVMFDRTRDWADLEAMVEAGGLDVEAVRKSVSTLVGPDDDRLARLDALPSRFER